MLFSAWSQVFVECERKVTGKMSTKGKRNVNWSYSFLYDAEQHHIFSEQLI